MKYQIEVTDTFNGEANYCWVRRAKAAVSYTGIKCRRDDIGDTIVLRPIGLLQIMFITPCY